MHHGMNLLDALREARSLGVRAEPVRRTGEVRFTHPLLPRPVTVNIRRKDASRATVGFLMKVAALTANCSAPMDKPWPDGRPGRRPDA